MFIVNGVSNICEKDMPLMKIRTISDPCDAKVRSGGIGEKNAVQRRQADMVTTVNALQQAVGNRAVGRLIRSEETLEPLRASDVGRPVPQAIQNAMAASMGHSLQSVRLHTGGKVAASAKALKARAYTVGRDIVFGAGQFSPDTRSGRRLIAHELVHALQQRRAPGRGKSTGVLKTDDPLERQADRIAGQVVRGRAAGPVSQLSSDAPVVMREEETGKKEETADKAEVKTAFGSPAWPWLVIEPLLFKLPRRWQTAIQKSKATGEYVLFDISLGRKLVFNQVMAFQNLFNAGVFTGMSAYKPDFSKGLDIAEGLSGVEDTYINLISLGLRLDLKKYLENDLPDIVQANLGWAIIYGLLLQGGLTGLNAAMEEDLNFTSLLKPALKKYTEAPLGFSRRYQLPNIPDPRWSAYPFSKSPSGVDIKLTDVFKEEKPYQLSMNLGFNIASMLDLYPEDEEKKKKYKGFELYPYFSFGHAWEKEGQAPPPTQHQWLAGVFFGGEGLYTLVEGGQRLSPGGERQETYLRQGWFLRELGPLSLLQLDTEHSLRPGDAGLRSRLNAATTIRLLDNKTWQLTVGGRIGGLLPERGLPGALDAGGEISLYHQYHRAASPEPFKTGFGLSAAYRHQDPFDPASPRLLSTKGSLSLFDILRISMEYHQVTGDTINVDLPGKDLRFMIYAGPGIVNF